MTIKQEAQQTWTGHRKDSVEYRRILIALLGAGIATFAQLYSPQGILPRLADDLHVSAAASGLVISASTIGLAVAVLPWSLVADRIGRVRAMRIALVAATVLGLVMPWSPWFSSLMVVRILEGAALGGIPAIAVTYLNEEVDARHAAIAAGSYVSGTSIGGLLGRLVAAPIADVAGWRIGTFVVAVMAALATATFFWITPPPRGFTPHSVSIRQVARATLEHLRSPRLVVLYVQGCLLMGGFVATYNYLAFRLEAAPFNMPVGLTSLLFLAYLAGTVSSRASGDLAARWGRGTVLIASTMMMIAGICITLSSSLPVIIVGLVIFTAGFFAAHSIASGWAGARTTRNRSQSTSLYNCWYYTGSSVFGYLGGVAWLHYGWGGLVTMVAGIALVAAVWALFAARGRS
ncbi:MFS transporter [Propionibacterium cyclohexanicum]|uniref:MFS transporter n=1 Tax=Propionibacterium cyclohexanicum TaxID=64702 RepID=UPI001FE1D82F|nr:MFS transporter [Propionibacterium cyclohexanicum]